MPSAGSRARLVQTLLILGKAATAVESSDGPLDVSALSPCANDDETLAACTQGIHQPVDDLAHIDRALVAALFLADGLNGLISAHSSSVKSLG